MILIEGLNPKQIDMLNHMWAIDSYESLIDWQDSLDHSDRVMSETLYELVLAASIDELVDHSENFDDAQEVISNIKGMLS